MWKRPGSGIMQMGMLPLSDCCSGYATPSEHCSFPHGPCPCGKTDQPNPASTGTSLIHRSPSKTSLPTRLLTTPSKDNPSRRIIGTTCHSCVFSGYGVVARAFFRHSHGGTGSGPAHNPLWESRASFSSAFSWVSSGACFRSHQHQPCYTNN